MSFRSLLARVLLSLLLVINGAGSAVAAVRMQVDQPAASMDMAGSAASQAQQPTDMACPHNGAASMAGASQDAPAHHARLDRAADRMTGHPTKPPAPDCCKSGSCRCVCTPVAQVISSPANIAVPALEAACSVRQPSLAHAAPTLPGLIRPPIG